MERIERGDEVATLAKQCEEMQVRLGKQEDELATLRAERDAANALLDEWLEAQFYGHVATELRARTRAFRRSDDKPMLTPEAAELATLRARLTQLEAALLYVSAELRHMRLTHQLGPHTVRKVDSLVRHCEAKTTPRAALTPEGT